jgi:CRISPR-associated endonuclease/helicase Cas3
MNFADFFRTATGNTPYDYQSRLAGNDPGTACHSQLINVPTGLGKTAAVVLAWLWNRAHLQHPQWPRRLVYCLPMRTLVEQTQDEARKWIAALHEHNLLQGNSPEVIILMGGEELEGGAKDWDLHPEREAILIGTQDMLLSRALNRGYGMSRYRWPMHFGLLNNDALWVMDETQLMGPGLGTACQLEAFRSGQGHGFGSIGTAGSVTWYMSATNNPEHLKTREWRGVTRSPEFEFALSPEERAATTGPVHQRRHAVKRLELKSERSFADTTASQTIVAEIVQRHRDMVTEIANEPGLPARTLIICNTVVRAVAVHAQLKSEKPEGCDLLLLHSRFRPPERREQMKRLESADRDAFPNGQIVVATQVIEAGVDISSGLLWSEVAPLASLVQRLGRLNRAGEFNESPWKPLAVVVGVGVQDAQPGEKKEAREKREKDNVQRCLPYKLPARGERGDPWTSLTKLDGNASPADLEQIQGDIAASIPRCPYSLQRHELLDFFDTDANLSLGFTDVSPFVRGLDDDTDLQVLWRESWLQRDDEEGTGEPGLAPDFQRDELCPVPISKAKVPKAREVLKHGWIWRGKESGWLSMRDLQPAPGMTILLPLDAGGYDNGVGWTGDGADNKHGARYQPQNAPTDEEQLSSLASGWQSIAVHTAAVTRELREELRHLLSAPEHKSEHSALLAAVPWHDVGKNHRTWQQAVLTALEQAGITGKEAHQPFAKFSLSDGPSLTGLQGEALKKRIRELRYSFRPGIAHEVASALAFRADEQARLGSARDPELASLLAEYVVMSHHGRVRKVLRDEIPKFPKDQKDTETVRGVSEGDPLPPVVIEGQPLGCAVRMLERMREFYLVYPQLAEGIPSSLMTKSLPAPLPSRKSSAAMTKSIRGRPKQPSLLPAEQVLRFSWTKLIELIRLDDPWKRAFYENECLRGNWSVRQLQRQIGSLLYDRTALSADKRLVIERGRRQALESPQELADIIRDPYVLEFTGLAEKAHHLEKDLETALLDHLQSFLLELGTGFCFEARQRRVTVANEHDYIDLVFYHRILRCHLLIDLKTRAFRHGDAGQMNYYLNYWKDQVMQPGDQPPVGLILCTNKDQTRVDYASAGLDRKMFVSRYLNVLPSTEVLQRLIEADAARWLQNHPAEE